jgi:hypothetical protein
MCFVRKISTIPVAQPGRSRLVDTVGRLRALVLGAEYKARLLASEATSHLRLRAHIQTDRKLASVRRKGIHAILNN